MSDTLPSVTAVVSRFPAPSQTFIRRKLDGLREAGVRVDVASTNFHEGAEQSGYRLVDLAPWQHPAELRTARGRHAWRSMASALASSGAPTPSTLRDRLVHLPLSAFETDVVHFEFSGIAVTYLDSLEWLSERARMVVSCRGAAEQIEPLKDPARATALAEVFARVDLVHCVSDDMRRTVEALGAPTDRILVNRPAVPVAKFASLRREPRLDGPLRVLSIGRLHWKKGFDDGLRAVAGLRDRGVDVEYRIAGDGEEREKLLFLIDQLGLDASAQLLGTCTEQQVLAQLADTDVLMLPSLSEGISNAALEAMAAGLPLVTTDCGGMTEVVTDSANGLVVGVGDVAALTDRLHDLAADPDLRARLGSAAAATADRDLDVSRQVDVFIEAYRRLTAP